MSKADLQSTTLLSLIILSESSTIRAKYDELVIDEKVSGGCVVEFEPVL